MLESEQQMDNITDEEVVWRTYPDYPFIEVNQFGEIRTKDRVVICKNGRKYPVKGRILKQHLHLNGYLFIHFKMNGKTVNLLVHRIVATCFLPNPNNLPEVNHKDNNPKNNAVSNLEWCTSKYNHDYKKNFGTSPAQIQGRPVFAVDLKTGKVLRFETQSEAVRQLGVSQWDIYDIIKGRYNQTGGYWFTEDESEITEERIQEIKEKAHFHNLVIAINPETSEVFWFKSQSEASRKLGISDSYINRVVKGKCNKAHGYWFCYADENAIENVREKFGDKMAKEVEKSINDIT